MLTLVSVSACVQYENLPLHLAAANKAEVQVLLALLEAYPEGASTADEVQEATLGVVSCMSCVCVCVCVCVVCVNLEVCGRMLMRYEEANMRCALVCVLFERKRERASERERKKQRER